MNRMEYKQVTDELTQLLWPESLLAEVHWGLMAEVWRRQPAGASSWSSWELPPGPWRPRCASYRGRTRPPGLPCLLRPEMLVERMR